MSVWCTVKYTYHADGFCQSNETWVATRARSTLIRVRVRPTTMKTWLWTCVRTVGIHLLDVGKALCLVVRATVQTYITHTKNHSFCSKWSQSLCHSEWLTAGAPVL